MKKFYSFIIIGAMLFAFGACGSKTSSEEESTDETLEEASEPAEEMMEEEMEEFPADTVDVDTVAADTTDM